MKKLLAILLSFYLIASPTAAVAGGGGSYAKQILGIANGIVGSSIIVKCSMASMQPSLMAYMAGSVVYIMAEIMGGKDQKKKMEEQAKKLDEIKATMKEGGDYQKASIDAQLEDNKKTLEHIKKRRKWIMAVKAIYAVAVGLAIYEFWRSLPIPVGQNIPDAGACVPNPAASIPMMKMVALAYSALQGFASNGTMGAAMAVGGGLMIETLGKFIFEMEAGTMIADMAISILNPALGRVAFFAGALILVQIIDSGLAKEEQETQKRISELEALKNQFNMQTQSTTILAEGSSTNNAAGANGDGTDGTDTNKKAYEISKLAQGTEAKKQCFAMENGAMTYSENGCRNPVKISRPKFDANMNLPTLVAGSNLANDLGQAVANGDMAKADVAAGELSNMASRIDAVKDSMMKKLNKDLVAQGKKPISGEDSLKAQIDNLNKAINEKKPGTGNYTMASLGDTSPSGSNGSSTASVSAIDPNAADANGDNVANTAEAPAPEVTPIGSEASALSSITEDSLGVANAEEALGILGSRKVESTVMNFENAKGDISAESDSSIFKQLSNRYFLNYNKFFQRKEVNPPLATPVPAN